MSTYRCMLRPTWMISALQHKSKYKSNSISNFFEKKNQIFWFPCCTTREDLSIDVSITNVGLILTKLRWFQLFVESQNSNFELFWKKKSNFWVSMLYYSWRPFHWCINYQCRTDIDEATVISALRRKSKFEFWTFLKKKIKFLGFHAVLLVKTFPLMYQLPM